MKLVSRLHRFGYNFYFETIRFWVGWQWLELVDDGNNESSSRLRPFGLSSSATRSETDRMWVRDLKNTSMNWRENVVKMCSQGDSNYTCFRFRTRVLGQNIIIVRCTICFFGAIQGLFCQRDLKKVLRNNLEEWLEHIAQVGNQPDFLDSHTLFHLHNFLVFILSSFFFNPFQKFLLHQAVIIKTVSIW